MNTGTVILIVGVGAAAFLYYRSQLAQAAALAAAQGAPAPGLVQKVENTLGGAAKAAGGIVGKTTNPFTTAYNVLSGNTSSTGGWNPNRQQSAAPSASFSVAGLGTTAATGTWLKGII